MAKKTNSILKTALGYGVGAIGLDLSYGMFYSYLSYYLSSVLGLEEAFLLLITGKGNETRQKRGIEYIDCPTDVEYATKALKKYDKRTVVTGD